MRVIVNEEDRELLIKYLPNALDYLDKELTREEYFEFECDLNDVIVYTLDEEYSSTKETTIVQGLYDRIYNAEE